MFTGLIEDIGTIAALERRSDSVILTIAPGATSTPIDVRELVLGESIAVDGVCLTVTTVDIAAEQPSFTVLAGAETLRRTTLGTLETGHRVNLERALRASDRLGGHMVSGHVDAVGTIASRTDLGANIDIVISAPAAILRYVVEKGSICVDGISLTVNRVDDHAFAVALIPHTVSMTTLASKPESTGVNLEVDIIGKYVEKLLGGYR